MLKGFAEALHQAVELGFAGVAEGRVSDVVGQGQCFREVVVEAEGSRDGARNLRHLNGVR